MSNSCGRSKIYCDESIHDRAGFILTALVVTDVDIDKSVDAAFLEAGLTPGIDEFKSSNKMANNPKLQQLRRDLNGVVYAANSSLALVISTRDERMIIAEQAVDLIAHMMKFGRFKGHDVDVVFDQGIKTSNAKNKGKKYKKLSNSTISGNQNSKIMRGLQIADHCAHVASTILLSDLGIVQKKIPAGDDMPFDPDEMLELEYLLWSDLGYALASNIPSYPGKDRRPTYFTEFDPFGLYISRACQSSLIEAIVQRFGNIYMGCIL